MDFCSEKSPNSINMLFFIIRMRASAYNVSSLSLSGYTNVPVLAHEEVFKGLFEGCIAQSVTSWVYCAVHVAEPIAYVPHCFRDASLTKCVYEDHDIVRRPCDDEC